MKGSTCLIVPSIKFEDKYRSCALANHKNGRSDETSPPLPTSAFHQAIFFSPNSKKEVHKNKASVGFADMFHASLAVASEILHSQTLAYFSQVRSLRTTHLSKEILESLLFVLREKKFLLIPLQAPLAKVHCTPNVCCSHKSIATIFLPPNDHRHT
jgi:hypothetical protein